MSKASSYAEAMKNQPTFYSPESSVEVAWVSDKGDLCLGTPVGARIISAEHIPQFIEWLKDTWDLR